jgi:hypothetical protein
MSARTVVCLTLVVFIALLSLCPVPFGHGPSSAVYGPATAFRAYRAALQLQFVFAAILSVALGLDTHSLRLPKISPLIAAVDEETPLLLIASTVCRC